MVRRFGTPLTVSIAAPPDSAYVWVRLVGDVDMLAEPALAEAIDRLDSRDVRLMVVDLTSVTFAGVSPAGDLGQVPPTAIVNAGYDEDALNRGHAQLRRGADANS